MVYGYKNISARIFEIHCISNNENSRYKKVMHTKKVSVYEKTKQQKHFSTVIIQMSSLSICVSKMLIKNVRHLMTYFDIYPRSLNFERYRFF